MNALSKRDSISTVLIDLDGTLADSLPIMLEVYYQFLKRHGIKGNRSEFNSLNGPNLDTIIQNLTNKYNLTQTLKASSTLYNSLIFENYHKVRPTKGSKNFILDCKSLGLEIGIVTSNQKSIVLDWLDSVYLKQYISFLVCGDDVTFSKPHPEPYLTAIHKAKRESSSILAIEDSLLGLNSSLSAGLTTFYIGRDDPKLIFDSKNLLIAKKFSEISKYLRIGKK